MSVGATFDDRTAIYRQIADRLRDDIARGVLSDDDQVMSTNQYAAFHRINPATVAKAFQELVDDGLLYKRRGVGMFVTPGSGERLRDERRARFVHDVLGPVLDEAERLAIPTDDILAVIRARSTTAKGQP
jgi:DNA-binding transcriptional regulator YhcF (GntR family)